MKPLPNITYTNIILLIAAGNLFRADIYLRVREGV